MRQVPQDRHASHQRHAKFYLTATSHSDLAAYYRTVFELKEYRQGGVWTVAEIDAMVPFELQLYIAQTKQRIAERKDAADAARRAAGG